MQPICLCSFFCKFFTTNKGWNIIKILVIYKKPFIIKANNDQAVLPGELDFLQCMDGNHQ